MAAVVLGVPLHHASVEPDPVKGTLGRVRTLPWSPLFTEGDQWQEIMAELERDRRNEASIVCSLAGRIAEERFTGEPGVGCLGDYRNVVHFLSAMGLTGRESRSAAFRSLRAQTERLIADHWDEVAAVAAALEERGRLNADEVRRAMSAAIREETLDRAVGGAQLSGDEPERSALPPQAADLVAVDDDARAA